MWGYAFKLALAGIAILLAGVLAILLFEGLWVRVGLGAAIVVVVGGLLFWAWRVDRRDKEWRQGVDDLPRV